VVGPWGAGDFYFDVVVVRIFSEVGAAVYLVVCVPVFHGFVGRGITFFAWCGPRIFRYFFLVRMVCWGIQGVCLGCGAVYVYVDGFDFEGSG
jgi:hypothetical protein